MHESRFLTFRVTVVETMMSSPRGEKGHEGSWRRSDTTYTGRMYGELVGTTASVRADEAAEGLAVELWLSRNVWSGVDLSDYLYLYHRLFGWSGTFCLKRRPQGFMRASALAASAIFLRAVHSPWGRHFRWTCVA